MTTLARARAVVFRFTRARPRLLLSFAFGVAVFLALSAAPALRMVSRLLVSWDAMLVAYLGLMITMVARSRVRDLKRRAAANDDKAGVILLLLVVALLASLVAIVVELATREPGQIVFSYALAFTTVVLSWFFTHAMFAVHYAHTYYAPDADGHVGGLAVPGHAPPDYLDFLYFSFVIGCATATADIDITSRGMRRLALVHGVLAFAYNTAIVALTINVAASHVGG